MLKKDAGSMSSEAPIYYLFIVFLISMVLGIMPVVSEYIKLDRMATEVLREAELSGNTGVTVMERYEDVAERYGIEPKSISFEGTKYIGSTKNVQINDEIEVVITYDYKWFSTMLDGGGINQQLSARASGRSGVYYK